MSEFVDHEDFAVSPFAGLVPTRLRLEAQYQNGPRNLTPTQSSHVARSMFATMPVLLAGTLAASTLNFGTTATLTSAKPEHRQRTPLAATPAVVDDSVDDSTAQAPTADPAGDIETAAVAPSTYTVRHGDTVSGIAGRYGLSTASVLALNGLSWKSLIFPGQVLKLSKASNIAPAVYVAPAAPAAPAAPSATGSYTIQRGDTVTSIARKFGVSIQAILTANNLVASSIIYTGRTLVIPGATSTASTPAAPTGTQVAQVGSAVVPLTPTMAANAQTIISVGRSLGVPSYGLVVALAAAAQESGLQDLTYGDRDSVGLFQQRPSTGWGTVAQLEDTSYASRLFFGGPSNPNKGKTRGLLDIAGWQSMTVAQAAQKVQISAYPNAYAKWETSAAAWLTQLGRA